MEQQEPANCEREYLISKSDLPAACPSSNMVTWNSHPRVYLGFKDGVARCPYCSAKFVLK